MISIIICSRQSSIPDALQKNVESSIGCDFEWVIVDNSKNLYSIAKAYNEGVSRAKGDILCFMHDDIRFLTNDWGQRVQNHLEEGVGVIGVIGNLMFPDCPSSWWTTSLRAGHVIQRSNTDDRNVDILFEKYRQGQLSYCEVATVDGLWMCMPRKIFEMVRFDEDTYSGFHCYDTDICMQTLAAGWNVRAIYDVAIEHYSLGALNKEFFQQRQLWYEKWKDRLPVWRGVELTRSEAEYIKEMAILVNEQLIEKVEAQNNLNDVRNSKAYLLGKKILKPFKWMVRR